MQDLFARDAAFAGADRAGALARLRETLPRPLVFTYGVFDVIHAGHLYLLEQARAHGASLVVGVRGDVASRRLRSSEWGAAPAPGPHGWRAGLSPAQEAFRRPGRPIHAAAERARVVAALGMVSAAVLFDEDKPLALICALRPDVVVKAGEGAASGHVAQCALLAEWGGRAVVVPRLAGWTSAGLLERIRPERSARPLP